MLKHPNQALCKLLSITLFLFVIGLMPWVDNYAHLFGFVFGFLLSYALLPFITFGPYDRQKKVVLIWVCLLSAAFLFSCLVLLFYIIPVYDCEVCSYFNCLPVTRDFCASQNINFKREENLVWHIFLRLLTVLFNPCYLNIFICYVIVVSSGFCYHQYETYCFIFKYFKVDF